MTKSLFRILAVTLATLLAFCAAAQQPNIIIIHADDHDQSALSAYGNALIATPNLDRLAKDGAIFSQSFVGNSICAPSRATLLTGKHSHKNGHIDNRKRFDSSQATLPKYLKTAGYQTAQVGKWHLVSQPTGFDYWRVLKGQGEYYNPRFQDAHGLKIDTGYVAELITNQALKWLNKRATTTDGQTKPFFLMVNHKSPHRNWLPPVKYMYALDDQTFPLPKSLFFRGSGTASKHQLMSIMDDMLPAGDLKLHKRVSQLLKVKGSEAAGMDTTYFENELRRMSPADRAAWKELSARRTMQFLDQMPTGDELLKYKYQLYMRDYLNCVRSLDEQVGRLLNYLDSTGLKDNTLIIYTSDQGFWLGQNGWFDKRFMYEQSMRTPLLMRWPGKIKAGARIDAMVQNIDITPTVLDAVGAKLPRDLDGISLVPHLLRQKAIDRDVLYYRYYEYPEPHRVLPHYGIRTATHKLIYFHTVNEWELYDLTKDPLEQDNLALKPTATALLKSMQKRLATAQQTYGDVR